MQIEQQKHRRIKIEKNTRPVLITTICFLNFIGIAALVPLLFFDILTDTVFWHPIFIGFSAIVGFFCTIGFWRMKRIAVYVYSTFFIINQIILKVFNEWNLISFVLLSVVIILLWRHIKDMG
jgi:hypothetical protein